MAQPESRLSETLCSVALIGELDSIEIGVRSLALLPNRYFAETRSDAEFQPILTESMTNRQILKLSFSN